MNAYVAVTDADWYGFLSRQEDLDEVNFWQPNPWGGELGVLRRGEPLLFKLKAPQNAIAGVGFFERYVTLPFSLAWDAFGVKNGAADRHAMWERIARLRVVPVGRGCTCRPARGCGGRARGRVSRSPSLR